MQNEQTITMSKTGIIFPHQLFEQNILVSKCGTIYLIEEWLYFNQFKFHKQKIALHRASMKFYESFLQSKRIKVIYIDSFNELADIRKLIPYLKTQGIDAVEYIDTTDNWLEKRIKETAKANKIEVNKNSSTLFINSKEEITDFFSNKKIPPTTQFLPINNFYTEAISYTQKHFPTNYGELNNSFIYPSTHEESKKWLIDFFKTRFSEFGAYEDAIVSKESILHHSVLTPMLNVGLLTSQFVIDEALQYASNHEIPINSLEGFIRQILGWREFIRAVYELKGSAERTKNYWGFTRKIPESFWKGTTGIEPIDETIKKILKTGYCHHIERLMVLGNFMLLCEFDPDEVYHWFMELFIDAYDWVMVPNVYGMSQFADGGLMATKPYISGSNYLMKMSDYKKGEWQQVWDGLFWRFMHTHRNFFLKNPRLGMLIKTFDKMPDIKKETHLKNAEHFLNSL